MDNEQKHGLMLVGAVGLLALAFTKKAGGNEPPPLPPPGSANLYGTVEDSLGVLSGVSVQVGSYSTTTKSDGTYIISSILPGTYDVSFSKSGYTTKETTMNLVDGNNTLNVTLVPVAVLATSLEGYVSDSVGGLPGVLVTVQGKNDTTDTTGYYIIEGLTPGNSAVTFSKSGYNSATR
jgi:hypothetical protein